MARLRVRLRGKHIQEIQLSQERSYLAGRRDECDIVLQGEKGISREHFKISFLDDKWQLEVFSKFNDVLLDGEKVQQAALEGQVIFYLGPYEFEYSEMSSDLVPVGARPLAAEGSEGLAYATPGEEDKTFIGTFNVVPYIKAVTEHGDIKELFRLEGGDTWVAGRDSSCDILIRDQRVSRRQFEVRRQGSQFLILDLESVNGTLLNGTPVSSLEPTVLKSGDAIGVLDNHFYFELHDPEFKARLEVLKSTAVNPLVPLSHEVAPTAQGYAAPPVAYYPPGASAPGMPYPMAGPAQVEGPKKFDFEKHRVKIIIGAVLFLAVAYLFSGSDQAPKPTAGGVVAKPNEAFSKLSPEQQILVKQTYLLAKNLYMQGKYELAKAEVTKIYEIVPEYEDTKDIERLASEALVIQDQKRRTEELEKAKAETEEKIQAKAAECKAKIHPEITSEQLEECISPVLQFNPDHPALAELRRQVEAIVTTRQMREAERAEHRALVQKLRNLYARAEASHRSNRYLKAIQEYQTVVSSRLPDPSDLKSDARKNISEIQQVLKQKTDQFATEAEQFYKDQKLKEAILTLRKSVDVDPNNEDPKDKISRYTLELKKQMMVLYQEGVLEESYGNVEGSESKPGAKDKWKKIIELDIPDGEYYQKAKIKLKKYGAF